MDESGDAVQAKAVLSWRVQVRGLVQGVNYRRYAQASALELGVRGWVRNEPDGSVTALLQHESAVLLMRLVAELREGPPAAEVYELKLEVLEDFTERCAGFVIVR